MEEKKTASAPPGKKPNLMYDNNVLKNWYPQFHQKQIYTLRKNSKVNQLSILFQMIR